MLATNETVKVPVGTFTKVVRTKDTTVLEPDGLEQQALRAGPRADRGGQVRPPDRRGRRGRPPDLRDAQRQAGDAGRLAQRLHRRQRHRQRHGADPDLRRNADPRERLSRAERARFADELEIVSKSQVTVVDSVLEDVSVQAAMPSGSERHRQRRSVDSSRRRLHFHSFSNYGSCADLYVVGRNHVNAFPHGTYVCVETPDKDDVRVFDRGLAKVGKAHRSRPRWSRAWSPLSGTWTTAGRSSRSRGAW